MNIDTLIENIEQAKCANNYTRARGIALRWLREFTDDYRLYEELTDIYIFEGNLEKAGEVLSIARELHPESSTGLYLEGYLATAKGDFSRAISTLTQANMQMPNNAEILRNLWWSYVMTGDLTKGLTLLRRAHNLAPDEPMVINDLSVALMAGGFEEEARTVLAKLGWSELLDTRKTSNT